MSAHRIASLVAVPVGVAGLLVALRALAGGPITVIAPIGRPLNLESVAALGLLLSLVLLGRGATDTSWRAGPRPLALLVLALLVTLSCYWKSLWFPFTSDDYVIVVRALRGELLGRVLIEGDASVAFRPLTRFLFAVQGWMGSADPARWHIVGLVIHLTNCVLVFLLARSFVAPGAAVFSAAVFGLHATHPEAVSWMNSRSDVFAVFFLLGALLLFLAHWRKPHWARLFAALLLATLAILSKESAYVFVPLAWLDLAAKDRPGWKGIRVLLPFVGLEAALFVYRWTVLGGMGGYSSAATGRSIFLTFDVLHTLKTLCWRAWAILFFPVNWQVSTTVFLGVTLVLAAGAMVGMCLAQANRRALAAFAGFVIVALVPVLALALVGADLLGSRLYYLPSVGFAMLMAVALDGVRPGWLRTGAATALLLFHFAALRHELSVWESVTQLARETCVEAGEYAARAPIVVRGLPNSVDGVFFLGNGFPECVELYARRKLPVSAGGSGAPEAQGLVWRRLPTGAQFDKLPH